ncbi:3-deoxy-D-manno-octulosonic acid transferase [Parapedobacter sp. DT-150]
MSFFNDKAKKWFSGRRDWQSRIAQEVDQRRGCIWFHFASLGEFEQGRPVLEAMKAQRQDKAIIITFYSPSGHEIRKNTPLADHVFYLPEDTPGNAEKFIRLINPELAVFTKYEYWPFYFRALASRHTPLYVISAIFRSDQVFFKWYGGFFRQALAAVTHFFTQNSESLALLARLGYTNASVAGDTRFDRVVELPKAPNPIPAIDGSINGRPVLVAGSTWPADEELLERLHQAYPDWVLVIAPHEVHDEHIRSIEKLFPHSVRFSQLPHHPSPTTGHSPQATSHQPVIIIDNIGMLSSLYAYAGVAYIGGGFGTGIHNTLEAATYGIPVIFGPNYQKFQEAKDLIACGAGFSVRNAAEFVAVFGKLTDRPIRDTAGNTARQYVQENAGATALILDHLTSDGWLA